MRSQRHSAGIKLRLKILLDLEPPHRDNEMGCTRVGAQSTPGQVAAGRAGVEESELIAVVGAGIDGGGAVVENVTVAVVEERMVVSAGSKLPLARRLFGMVVSLKLASHCSCDALE